MPASHYLLPPPGKWACRKVYQHLKSALRARLSNPNWIRELPWVLLGIRTAPKEELHCSSAEIVYGAPLTVPGDFIPKPLSKAPDRIGQHLRQLRETVRFLVPTPTSQHGSVTPLVPPALQLAKFGFIRQDGHHTPLQRPLLESLSQAVNRLKWILVVVLQPCQPIG